MKKNRFVMGRSPISRDVLLFIEDYAWWIQNEKDVVMWMDDNLSQGRDHQQGMVITFDNDQQRLAFMLRWA
jgi:hypothetical protein